VVQVGGLCTEPLVYDGNAQIAKQGVEEDHLQAQNRAAHTATPQNQLLQTDSKPTQQRCSSKVSSKYQNLSAD
jgi:hypothetical protein